MNSSNIRKAMIIFLQSILFFNLLTTTEATSVTPTFTPKFLDTAATKTKVIKIGGIFQIFDNNGTGNFDADQGHSLAAFLLAISEINNSSEILPEHRIEYAVRSGHAFTGAVRSAESLNKANYTTELCTSGPIGVDAVVIAGTDLETHSAAQYFAETPLVSIHTVSMEADFRDGSKFNYHAQTTPVSSYQGEVWQHLLCERFNYTKIAVFYTDDPFGTYSSEALLDQSVCGSLKALSVYAIKIDQTDFSREIANTKKAGALIFVLFMGPETAARLLEQGHEQGLFREGTQIFGSHEMTSPQLWKHMRDQNPEKIKAIMKGYIGIHYDPGYAMTIPPYGPAFVDAFRSLPNTYSIDPTTQAKVCHDDMDDTEQFNLYRHESTSACAGLDFSSITNTSIYEFAPHAYDAVWALARAFDKLHQVSMLTSSTLTTERLYHTLIHNVTFEGASGQIGFNVGDAEYPYYSRGNRNEGHFYLMYNFHEEVYDSSGGNDGLVVFGDWNPEEGYADCSKVVVVGATCSSAMHYNTVDNSMPSDSPPYKYSHPPSVIKIGGYFSPFDENGDFDADQAHDVASFYMAIDQINSRSDILPRTKLVASIFDGHGFYGAVKAAASLATSSFGGSGVSVAIGSGDNIEGKAWAEMLGHFKIISINTKASDPDLQTGSSYPYQLQTTPLDSYQGLAWQYIICGKFGYSKISIFATDDLLGGAAAYELSDQSICKLDILSMHSFRFDAADFTEEIKLTKRSGAQIFVLFMGPATAARLLEQGHEQGLFREGTQIFGSHEMTSPQLWKHMRDQNPEKIKAIMKGYIGIHYDPGYAMTIPPYGPAFVDAFRSLPNTVSIDANGVEHCNDRLDDAGAYYLYREQMHLDSSNVRCSGLNFSALREDGSDIYPYAAHVYDAVYTAAYALDELLQKHNYTSIDGDLLYDTLLHRPNFEGATGEIGFNPGDHDFPYLSRGNRKEGHYYILYNFHEDDFDATGGNDALVKVGNWEHHHGFQDCSEYASTATNCVSNIKYKTKHNEPPLDAPPPIFDVLDVSVRGFLYALSACCLIVVSVFVYMAVRYRQSKLLKASQLGMVAFILFGCFIGSVRVLISGIDVTDGSCTAQIWLGHLSFAFVFGALFLKTWRVHRVVNNSGMKRVRITTTYVMSLMLGFIVSMVSYLAIVNGVGKPHVYEKVTTINNQTKHEYLCAFQPKMAPLMTALYAFEAAILVLGARLCWAVKDVPDAINESKVIATAMTMILLICSFAFPIIFLLDLPPSVQLLIAGLGFALSTILVAIVIFAPKAMILLSGQDIDGISGRKKALQIKGGGSPSTSDASHTLAAANLNSTATAKAFDPNFLRDKKLAFDVKTQMVHQQIALWRGALLAMEEESSTGSGSAGSHAVSTKPQSSSYVGREASVVIVAVDKLNSSIHDPEVGFTNASLNKDGSIHEP